MQSTNQMHPHFTGLDKQLANANFPIGSQAITCFSAVTRLTQNESAVTLS